MYRVAGYLRDVEKDTVLVVERHELEDPPEPRIAQLRRIRVRLEWFGSRVTVRPRGGRTGERCRKLLR